MKSRHVALAAVGLALLTMFLLQRRFGAPPPPRQFAALDGLRGYAAFLVFLHHTAIWHAFVLAAAVLHYIAVCMIVFAAP